MTKNIEQYLEEIEAKFSVELIPAQPEILQEINNEISREYPEFDRLANIIKKDVSLSSSILMIINSAYFGLREKIVSIPHAVMLLGIDNLHNIVKSVMLRKMFKGSDRFINDFWVTSTETAEFCAFLTSLLGRVSPEKAYTLGLFHNAGLAILHQQFTDFTKIFQHGIMEPDYPVTQFEKKRFGINHSEVGAILSKKWGMHMDFCQLIFYHHRVDDFLKSKDMEISHVDQFCILKLAEHLTYRLHKNKLISHKLEWNKIGRQVLRKLNLFEDDVDDLMNKIQEIRRGPED